MVGEGGISGRRKIMCEDSRVSEEPVLPKVLKDIHCEEKQTRERLAQDMSGERGKS